MNKLSESAITCLKGALEILECMYDGENDPCPCDNTDKIQDCRYCSAKKDVESAIKKLGGGNVG